MRGGGVRDTLEDDEVAVILAGVDTVTATAVGKEVAQNTISCISLSSLRISSVLAATKYDDGVPSMTAEMLFIRAFRLVSCWDIVSKAAVVVGCKIGG